MLGKNISVNFTLEQACLALFGYGMKAASTEKTCFSFLSSWRFFKVCFLWRSRNQRGNSTQ